MYNNIYIYICIIIYIYIYYSIYIYYIIKHIHIAKQSDSVVRYIVLLYIHNIILLYIHNIISLYIQICEETLLVLVGGFKHFLFSIVYGTILPIDSYFSRWRKTTNQIEDIVLKTSLLTHLIVKWENPAPNGCV